MKTLSGIRSKQSNNLQEDPLGFFAFCDATTAPELYERVQRTMEQERWKRKEQRDKRKIKMKLY